ncbi:hypothetical protein BGW80DRAFT_1450677 [Lactifluus volemus]|nr:hypothetical protein BGW80DRAFT_1450677 [Lactifluus volemus]
MSPRSHIPGTQSSTSIPVAPSRASGRQRTLTMKQQLAVDMQTQRQSNTRARQEMQILRARQENQEQHDYSLDPRYDGPESEDDDLDDTDAGFSSTTISLPKKAAPTPNAGSPAISIRQDQNVQVHEPGGITSGVSVNEKRDDNEKRDEFLVFEASLVIRREGGVLDALLGQWARPLYMFFLVKRKIVERKGECKGRAEEALHRQRSERLALARDVAR